MGKLCKKAMNIPFYHKENEGDVTCAPVCLRMALAYFKIYKKIEKVYQMARSLGDCHYTLPWGMCIGAASVGLNATFISREPNELLLRYRDIIAKIAKMPRNEVTSQAKAQKKECLKNNSISLLPWKEEYSDLPGRVVAKEAGVVIPTVWWEERDAHNIVLTGFDAMHVVYHDPNFETGGNDNSMPTEKFLRIWRHKNTDNDLLVISKSHLDVTDYVTV